MCNLQASALLARVGRVDVPPDLLRDVLHAHAHSAPRSAARGQADTLTGLILGRLAGGLSAGSQADIALAARLRILSLACLVRDHVVDD
jgi:hypothetical protein